MAGAMDESEATVEPASHNPWPLPSSMMKARVKYLIPEAEDIEAKFVELSTWMYGAKTRAGSVAMAVADANESNAKAAAARHHVRLGLGHEGCEVAYSGWVCFIVGGCIGGSMYRCLSTANSKNI